MISKLKCITSVLVFYIALTTSAQNPVPYLKKNGKYIYVDSATMQPSLLIKGEFEAAYIFKNGVAITKDQQNKTQFFNEEGEIIEICNTYPCHPFFDNGVSLALKEGILYALIDKSGKNLTPFKFKSLIEYGEGFFLMKDEAGYFTYVDASGKEIDNIVGDVGSFKEVSPFKNGYARVHSNYIGSYKAFINKQGNRLPNLGYYDNLFDFSEGLAGVGNWAPNNSYGYVDETGKRVIELRYSRVRPFSQGYALVDLMQSKGTYCIVIDKKGKEILKFLWGERYDYSLSDYYYGLVAVGFKRNGKPVKGFINMKGKLIGEKYFDHVELPGAGLVAAGKYKPNTNPGITELQILDTNLKPLSDKIYNEVGKLGSHGLISVMVGGKYGYINTSGKEVISTRYEKRNEFVNGFALVKYSDSPFFYVDAFGREFREQ